VPTPQSQQHDQIRRSIALSTVCLFAQLIEQAEQPLLQFISFSICALEDGEKWGEQQSRLGLPHIFLAVS
jgi:hypothetical protein